MYMQQMTLQTFLLPLMNLVSFTQGPSALHTVKHGLSQLSCALQGLASGETVAAKSAADKAAPASKPEDKLLSKIGPAGTGRHCVVGTLALLTKAGGSW